VEDDTEIVVGFGVVGIGGDGCAVPGDRCGRSARFMAQTAHQIEDFGPIGLDLQRLATPPLGLLQIPGLHRLKGFGNGVGEGRHG
jgi:hypothetical protein